MVEGGQPQSANVYGKTRQYMEGGDDMDKTIIVLLIVLALTELVREIKKANLKFCVGLEIHALKFYVGLATRKGGHRLNSKFNLCPFYD